MKQAKKAKWAKHSNRSAERPEQLGKLKQNLPFSPGISGAAAPRRGLTALSPEYFIAEFRLATAFWAPAGGLAEYAASSINSRRHESNSRHRREHHFCTFTLPHILPGIVAANRSPISDKSRRPPQTSSYVINAKLRELAQESLKPEGVEVILILRFVLDLGDAEIGSLVGMSRSAVQRHRKKTLDELRNKLTALMPKGG